MPTAMGPLIQFIESPLYNPRTIPSSLSEFKKRRLLAELWMDLQPKGWNVPVDVGQRAPKGVVGESVEA